MGGRAGDFILPPTPLGGRERRQVQTRDLVLGGDPSLTPLAWVLRCGGLDPGLLPICCASCTCKVRIRHLLVTPPIINLFNVPLSLLQLGSALCPPHPIFWTFGLASGLQPSYSVPRLKVWIRLAPGPGAAPFLHRSESRGNDRGFLFAKFSRCLH